MLDSTRHSQVPNVWKHQMSVGFYRIIVVTLLFDQLWRRHHTQSLRGGWCLCESSPDESANSVWGWMPSETSTRHAWWECEQCAEIQASCVCIDAVAFVGIFADACERRSWTAWKMQGQAWSLGCQRDTRNGRRSDSILIPWFLKLLMFCLSCHICGAASHVLIVVSHLRCCCPCSACLIVSVHASLVLILPMRLRLETRMSESLPSLYSCSFSALMWSAFFALLTYIYASHS